MREKEKEAATSIDGTHPHNGIDHIHYILFDLVVDAIDLQSLISGRCCFAMAGGKGAVECQKMK